MQYIHSALEQVHQQFIQADLYYGHGTDNAWDEACWLVLFVAGLSLESDDTVLQQELTEAQQQRILSVAQQRIETQKPLAYLLNEAYFCGLPFYVDERVLVPRSPMAELIQQQFRPWIAPERVQQVLDLCTGSGCIAIATAFALPEAQVDASDISADALAVAERNIIKHGLQDRVHLLQSDGFTDIPPKQYDVIISNPPYVDQQDIDSMPPEYGHEPEIGLASGEDGLLLTTQLLQQAERYLSEQGVLIIEVGNSAEALMQQYPDWPFTWLEFACGGQGVFMLTKAHFDQVGAA